MSRKEEIKTILSVLCTVAFIAFCIWLGSKNGFGAQCKKAGYEGAQLELCINRRVKGGPIYEENIGRME